MQSFKCTPLYNTINIDKVVCGGVPPQCEMLRGTQGFNTPSAPLLRFFWHPNWDLHWIAYKKFQKWPPPLLRYLTPLAPPFEVASLTPGFSNEQPVKYTYLPGYGCYWLCVVSFYKVWKYYWYFPISLHVSYANYRTLRLIDWMTLDETNWK